MKTAIIAVMFASVLSMCDQGQHLGNFKQDCETAKGTYERIEGSDYKCTMPDGKVTFSK
jgi:hypothetical protein